jgi:hypothetical protein
MRGEKPSYYAVIPASVRYDKGLTANAKLLYGEITALCGKEGYCWAGNQYFADLYSTTPRTARRWIEELETGGFIKVGYRYVAGTKEIETRVIRINEAGGDKNVTACGRANGVQEAEGRERAKNKSVSAGEAPAEPDTEAAADKGDDKNVTAYGQKCHEAGTKMSAGDDKNDQRSGQKCPHNITNNIFKESSSPEIQSGGQPEEEERHISKNKDLRKMFLDADKGLVFDDLFYINAARFLEERELPDDYADWLCKLCKEQKPVRLRNYYYKLFFSPQMAELYKQREAAHETPKSARGMFQMKQTCPVCAESVADGENECPRCRFDMKDKTDAVKINTARDKFRRRNAEISRLREKNMDAAHLIKAIAEINKRDSA